MTRLQGLVFRLMARTLILFLMTAAGRSQSTSGGILGGVTDPSGSAVPGILSLRSGLPANVIRNGQRRGILKVCGPTYCIFLRWLRRSKLWNAGSTLRFLAHRTGETESGNAGRHLVRGPSFHNLDFSLFKELPLKPLGEGAELQLRFEFFNLTNTPNFDRPNTDFSRGDFGSITRTVANPRITQFALKVIF